MASTAASIRTISSVQLKIGNSEKSETVFDTKNLYRREHELWNEVDSLLEKIQSNIRGLLERG